MDSNKRNLIWGSALLAGGYLIWTVMKTSNIGPGPGTNPTAKSFPVKYHTYSNSIQVPDSFDGRQVWGNWLSPVVNQGQCNICWAVASSSSLADRFAIWSQGQIQIQLGAADIALCSYNMDSQFFSAFTTNASSVQPMINKQFGKAGPCQGSIGSLELGGYTLMTRGCATEDQVPLSSVVSSSPVTCSAIGGLNKTTPRYKAIDFYALQKDTSFWEKHESGSDEELMKEIYLRGPIASALRTSLEFRKWNGLGIFNHALADKQPEGHAIVVVGWGTSPTPHWICRNSWGTEFGEKGYFRIGRENGGDIPMNALGIVPDLGQNRQLQSFDPWGSMPIGWNTQWKSYSDMWTAKVGTAAINVDPATIKVFEFLNNNANV